MWIARLPVCVLFQNVYGNNSTKDGPTSKALFCEISFLMFTRLYPTTLNTRNYIMCGRAPTVRFFHIH